MSSFGNYGYGPWVVRYPEQTNRFQTEEEVLEWASRYGGKVDYDGRQDSGDLREVMAEVDLANPRKQT